MDHSQAAELITEALARAIANDTNGAATALETIGQQSDDNQMYGACCAISSAGVHFLKQIYGARAAAMAKNDMWVLEELEPGALAGNPPKAFAVRFLIAYANGDTSTCLALYNTALKASGEEYVASVCALLADVAGIARLALEEKNRPASGQ